MQVDRYGRLKPTTQGVWERVARKHYQHITGLEVIYRPNTWDWEVIGGPSDGFRFATLSVAQHAATMHFKGAR
jgi:hypothetical protein